MQVKRIKAYSSDYYQWLLLESSNLKIRDVLSFMARRDWELAREKMTPIN